MYLNENILPPTPQWMIPDDTLHLSLYYPWFGMQGSLNFDFTISPYTINLFSFLL